MSKNFFIALCGLTIAAVSASVFTSCGNTTKQQGLEAVQDSAQVSYEGLLSTLDSLGYTYEAHPLVGYFKITKGNSGANVDINPDGSLSYFLYNHDNATDEDRAFTQLAVAAFESAGFKDNGPGEDSSDNLLTPIDETKAFDEAALELSLIHI